MSRTFIQTQELADGLVIKLSDGTVASPSLLFTLEPTTGFYRIGSGDVAFSLGGVKNLELTSAQTSIPNDLLLSGHNKSVIFTDNAANTVTVHAPNGVTSWTLQLPQTKGLNGQVMRTDGNGVTDWVTAGTGSGTVDFGTQYQLAFYPTSTNEVSGSSSIKTDASGRFLVGASVARTDLYDVFSNQFEGLSGAAASLSITRDSNDGNPSYLVLNKSRGTSLGGITAVTVSDNLGSITFAGGDGTNLASRAASIYATVDGAVATGSVPGRLEFNTTAVSGTVPQLRMTIAQNGSVGIGVYPSAPFDIVGSGIYIQNNATNNTQKVARIGSRAYANAAAFFPIVYGTSSGVGTNDSSITIGGGTGSGYAACSIYFNTAANDTTVNGTTRMTIDSSGNVAIGVTPSGQNFQVTANTQNTTFSSASSAGYSRVFFNNDSGHGPVILTYGSGFAGNSTFGNITFGTVPNADFSYFISTTGNAFAMGTNSIAPLIFSMNALEVGRFHTNSNFYVNRVNAGGIVASTVGNPDETNAASGATQFIIVGNTNGSTAGDPWINFKIAGIQGWSVGIDNSDSDKFKISGSNTLGTSDCLTIDALGLATFTGVSNESVFINSALHTNSILAFNINNVTTSFLGASGAAGNIVPGSVEGDLCIRTASHNILFTVDGGSTENAVMTTTGLGVNLGTGNTPNFQLHARANASVVSRPTMTLEGGPGGYGAGVQFASRYSDTLVLAEMARITADGDGAWTSSGGTQSASIRFFTTSAGTSAERMRLTATGKFSVNSNQGTYQLYAKGGNTNNLGIDNDGSQYTEVDLLNNGTFKTGWYYDNTNAKVAFTTVGGYFSFGKNITTVNGSAGFTAYSFDSESNMGMYHHASGVLGFSVGGVAQITIGTVGVTFSGILQIPDGSAAAPVFSFNNDTNTGIYRVSSDVIGFASNGQASQYIAYDGTYIIDGSAGYAALKFIADTDTGLFRLASNTLGIACGGAQVFQIDTVNALFSTVVRPYSDNTYSLGNASYRWSSIYGVTIYSGDIEMENKWRITEGEKVGHPEEGIMFVSPSGKKYKIAMTEVD